MANFEQAYIAELLADIGDSGTVSRLLTPAFAICLATGRLAAQGWDKVAPAPFPEAAYHLPPLGAARAGRKSTHLLAASQRFLC